MRVRVSYKCNSIPYLSRWQSKTSFVSSNREPTSNVFRAHRTWGESCRPRTCLTTMRIVISSPTQMMETTEPTNSRIWTIPTRPLSNRSTNPICSSVRSNWTRRLVKSRRTHTNSMLPVINAVPLPMHRRIIHYRQCPYRARKPTESMWCPLRLESRRNNPLRQPYQSKSNNS